MSTPSTVAYAHSLEGRPCEEWEPLRVHLERVADLAGSFSAAFGAEEWGRLAGLWHDLGKYRPEFQARLRGSGAQVEHAGAGAALAAEKGPRGLPLAFAIAGHHCGLANRAARGEDGRITPLTERVARNRQTMEGLRVTVPVDLAAHTLPLPHHALQAGNLPTDRLKRRADLWTRFLFSALVDADRLATEAFCSPDESERRTSTARSSVADLRTCIDNHLDGLQGDSVVNSLRREVLADCRVAADQRSGFFSLTAPTGSGKTLASMAFALRHAERHHLRRVVVVVPYTSIIEQNARVYSDVLGAENIIEHHSNLDEEEREEENRSAEIRRRLATENWDAPIIVTTTVQFFESLFSNHPGRCRKLHNLAQAVIVLDEVQNIPAGYLAPILEVLQDLVDVFGSTVVLSTATQPALGRRPALPDGLVGVHEIIRDPLLLSKGLERVAVYRGCTDRWRPGGRRTRRGGRNVRRVLLVEDNTDLAFGLQTSLEVEGYEVLHADTGPRGVELAQSRSPDLVVLDLMLPEMNGYEVLRQLRRARLDMPVLIMTAKGEEVDKVQGFRLGADDYVVKPVGVLEFLARVEALLRRAQPRVAGEVFRYDDLEVDLGRRTVAVSGQEIELSPLEFDLVAALARGRGAVVSRSELLKDVWGYRSSTESRTVDTHIAKLRSKIDRGERSHVVTVRKKGYRLR